MSGVPSLSEPFKATEPLPVGDCAVVGIELHARRVQVMVDDGLPEGLQGHLAVAEQRDRFAQRGRDPRAGRGVGVPAELRRELQLGVDAVQTGGYERGHCQVGVDVTAGEAALDPQ